MKTFHPHLLASLEEALAEVLSSEKPADRIVERILKSKPKWGSRDRRFFAEAVYETVRWKRRNHYLLGEPAEPRPLLLWAAGERLAGREVPEELRTALDAVPVDPLDAVPAHPLAAAPLKYRASIPDWLDEIGSAELGARWEPLILALNEPAPVDLRANTLKASRAEVMSRLAAEGIETDPLPASPDGCTLRARKTVTGLAVFKEGLFEVQDRASQRVAPLLGARPGETVIDACAGAGGKTLHLAALLRNQGRLTALDVNEGKLRELTERARRAGATVARTRKIEAGTMAALAGTADRLLLDVPCSGLGTLRRSPDIKWKLRPERLTELRALQRSILAEYSVALKEGGTLVYATCSVLPSENELQVRAFLEAHPGFRLEEELTLGPDLGHGDGFYAARLTKGRIAGS